MNVFGWIARPTVDPVLGGDAADNSISGVEGNSRLTSATGIVLLALLAVEGVTILSVRQMITLHIFVGVLLLGPVLLQERQHDLPLRQVLPRCADLPGEGSAAATTSDSGAVGHRIESGVVGHRDRPDIRGDIRVGRSVDGPSDLFLGVGGGDDGPRAGACVGGGGHQPGRDSRPPSRSGRTRPPAANGCRGRGVGDRGRGRDHPASDRRVPGSVSRRTTMPSRFAAGGRHSVRGTPRSHEALSGQDRCR